MTIPAGALPKSLALVRIATGVFFTFFGQYKVFGAAFIDGGFHRYIEGYIQQNQAVGFYKVFLATVVLPHTELFAYVVGWGELLIGIGLVLGLWVQAASLAGALHMLSLTLATWHAPGAGAPLWQYFGAQLGHLPLVFLFVLFFVGEAGQAWGLDSLFRRQAKAK